MRGAPTYPECFLLPGELAVSTTPLVVKTILGSCVAVCLWDPAVRVGGINHFLLPRPPRGAEESSRFGTVALRSIIRGVLRNGAHLDRLRAAVIGGGSPVETIERVTIGEDNRAVALEILAEHGIMVHYEDTGGNHGRKLTFYTDTGRLLVEIVRGLPGGPTTGA